jgi:hypothetical protein
MSPLARFLLWSYERGSLSYGLLWMAVLLFLLLVPRSWVADPMVVRP